MDHAENCDALEREIDQFASVMSSMPRSEGIVTCPGWTVVDIAEHLGLIHRWAEELVRIRSRERIARVRSIDDRTTVTPAWIRSGGAMLVATLRSAEPSGEMWAWGPDQHVRFWSRRQLHETLVHRMDLEISAHIDPSIDPDIASDAIDEFLSNFEKVGGHSPDLRGGGERLVFRVSDGPDSWSITLSEDGFQVSRDQGAGEVEVTGPAKELLLVLVRRRPWREAPIEVFGDDQLLDRWLAHSAFD